VSWSVRARHVLDRLRGRPIEHDLAPYRAALARIADLEAGLAHLADEQILQAGQALRQRVGAGAALDGVMPEAFALVREAARRVLGQRPFDVQMLAGLAMHRGHVVQMATGEGKTLAAVAPTFLASLTGRGAHVLTFNDYLARRDAAWMGPVYRALGATIGSVQEGQEPHERRAAYAADVTYVTAKEAGFDYLRDGLVLEPEDLVLRPFDFAIVDEADSILIDEARVPLVIAGETGETLVGPQRLAALVRTLERGVHFDTDEYAHVISLTEAGLARAEAVLGCGDLYATENLELHARLRHALHAEYLLHRDVDYIVRRDRVELVDDFTGRVAEKRHWPDGLQAAVEAKEGVNLNAEGRILGSITLQHFLRLYPRLSGMTATAATSADELHSFYEVIVTVVPTHRPMIRVDHPDVVFTHAEAKRAELVEEIERVHASGRPILVGTASVGESEELAAHLQERGVDCQVLNAKNDEAEASVIARAGALHAVTISTNMAGRGTDIRLGGPDESQREAVVELGGLYVIGTNRHSSRRIDDQLRGRAGRQGDPGSSRFFVSLEDELLRRYGVENLVGTRGLPARQTAAIERPLVRAEISRAQRVIEGESWETRRMLYAYSEPVERQRRLVATWRRDALENGAQAPTLAEGHPERWTMLAGRVGEAALREIERRLTLHVIDRAWTDYLAEVREMRDDSHLQIFAGRLPLAEFHREVGQTFLALEERIDKDLGEAFETLEVSEAGVDWDRAQLRGPSATWTYVVSENPYGVSTAMSILHRPSMTFAAVIVPYLVLAQGLAQLRWRRARRSRHTR